MTKINLLKDQTSDLAKPDKGVSIDLSIVKDYVKKAKKIFVSTGHSVQRLIIFTVILVVPFALVKGKEMWDINILKRELKSWTQKEAQIVKDIETSKQVLTKTKEQGKTTEALEAKLGVIGDLSVVRLQEIKFLDTLQSIIPEEVWLSNFSCNDKKFTMQGSSFSDDRVNEFEKALDRDGRFKSVVLERSLREATTFSGRKGVLNKFVINGHLVEPE